jgi:EAL domain-containing protein (putative c-di-GMP-specific phosphodiesterase class I)
VEALVRCRVSGLETPAALFAAAERLGLAERISSMCRTQALRTLASHAPGLALFLNTHPREHLGPELLHSLAELRRQADSRAIVLEIHEAAVPELATIREFRKGLCDLQIGMAYDDFGAGQSRLRELSIVPPDYLKFDRQLLQELENSSAAHRALVRSLVRMAADQGIATVAEGLDDEATVAACRELGFTHFQGFYFGRPTAVAELPADVNHPRAAL